VANDLVGALASLSNGGNALGIRLPTPLSRPDLMQMQARRAPSQCSIEQPDTRDRAQGASHPAETERRP
jgi:hypothetical protein